MSKKLMMVAASLMISQTAFAQDDTRTLGRDVAETVFGSIEEHPNELIDMGEFVNFGTSIFTAMDYDDSASVNFEEFTIFDFGFNLAAQDSGQEQAYRAAQRIIFTFWDRNGNGKIDTREYRQALNTDFQRADTNHDALLSRDEFMEGYVVNIAYRAALSEPAGPEVTTTE